MKQWIIAVSEWSNVPHPPIDSLTKPSGDKAQASSAGSDAGSITAGSITGVDSVIEGEHLLNKRFSKEISFPVYWSTLYSESCWSCSTASYT